MERLHLRNRNLQEGVDRGSTHGRELRSFRLALGGERKSMLFDIIETPPQEWTQAALAESCSPLAGNLGRAHSDLSILWFL